MAPDHRSTAPDDAPFSYTAFGLSVRSCLELPELTAHEPDGDADVVIRRGAVAVQPDPEAEGPTVAALGDGGELMYALAGVGSFLARSGQEITVDPAAGVEPRVLRLSLLGPAMSLLLHQRGYLLLHASSAVVGGRAALFVGGHNRGKSTMATAMAARGHVMLADDLTCLDPSAQPPCVLPGIRQVKLCPDAAEALVPEGEELRELHPDSPKLGFRPGASPAAAAPIARVYFLEEGDEVEIRPIESGRALAQLITHWYGGRFGRAMLDLVEDSQLFLRCVQIASAASFRILARPTSLDLLPRVTEAVEEDMATRERSAV